MKITLAQRMTLAKYGIPVYEESRDTLIAIYDKILDIGFLPGDDYNLLNPTGLKLDKLYDEIYEQNRYGDLE